ncbi:MAG TPA: HEXXH motif-containing putative peptide modification protein [Dongiaceae bacterium]|nr:HEXXH motif-containing putative peptide modification protein [Dongiaceae bacterium]
MLRGQLAPPDPDSAARLDTRVAAATAARLRRLERRLAERGGGSGGDRRELRRLTRAARALLGEIPGRLRVETLRGPDLRGFLAEAETWLRVERLAVAVAAARRRTAGRAALEAELFERISRTEHLVHLVPRGRLDARFAARARRFAGERLGRMASDLGATLVGARLAAGPAARRLDAALTARASAEQGRPGARIDLGSIAGPAGPLGLRARPGSRLRVRLERGLLRIDTGAARPRFVPAAGTLFAGVRAPLVTRRRIPGSPILLAPALRSTPRSLRVGRDLPGLDARLGRALRLVRLAWPGAHRDLLARTAMVVPVREPRLVSYSLADRPGISFINVHAKRTLVLADDLVHENAHHLLHDIEAVTRLVPPGPEAEEVQAFDSPWRGERRPLRGILHGTFTFLFRAELFARLIEARAARPAPVTPLLAPRDPAFLRRELRRELDLIGRGLDDLRRAGAVRLLTRDGRALLRQMEAWRGRIRRRAGRLAPRRASRYDARVPQPGTRRRP